MRVVTGQRKPEAISASAIRRHALGAGAVRFAERNAVAFDVLNHSGRGNFSGEINDGPDHAASFNRRRNHAAGIDAFQTQSFPLAAEALKIPPRNSVLRADDGGLGPSTGFNCGASCGRPCAFTPRKTTSTGPTCFERTGDSGPRYKISFAAFHLHAMLLHGAKMRPAREESDVEPGLRHAGADIGSDCAGPSDQEFHGRLPTLIIHQRGGDGAAANFSSRSGRNTLHQINLLRTFDIPPATRGNA